MTRPLSYRIARDRCRVMVVVSRQPTIDEFIAVANRVVEDPDFRPGDDVLCDRRAAELPSRSFIENASQWLRQNAMRFGDGRFALVVASESPAQYGMGRMAEILSEFGERFRVFTDLHQAVAWLDERVSVVPSVRKRPEI